MFDAIALPRHAGPALPLPTVLAPATPAPMFARVAGGAQALVPGVPAGDGAAPPPAPIFDRLVASDLVTRAVRRARWTLAAASLQALVIAAVLTGSAHAHDRRARDTIVEIAIVVPRATRARSVPPPPPPPPISAARTGAGTARPKVASAPRPIPPMAIVQPREVRPTMKAPDPAEPREDAGEGDGGAEGGVVGGVVGGVPGGVIGGVVGAETLSDQPAARRGGEIEDAPQYASAGFRRPAERDPGCLRRAIRVPRELAGYVSGQVVLKFAVGRDGAVGRIEVMAGEPDGRIVEAIAQALRACAWVPGADARGIPVALWVILPLRFEAT